MLTVVQFPLTDVRLFLDDDTRRVAAPVWPIVYIPDEPYKAPFVRGFGRARKRRRGGVEEWTAEDSYCDISHGLRLKRATLKRTPTSSSNRLRAYCAFRRMFWDGQLLKRDQGSVEQIQPVRSFVGRAEVGFGIRFARAQPLNGASVGQLLDDVLRQEVAVIAGQSSQPAGGQKPAKHVSLSNAGGLLAKAYLYASTHADSFARLEGRSWWVQAGSPLVICEYVRDVEVELLPAHTVPVSLSATRFSGLRVFLGRRTLEGRERPVWFFEKAGPLSFDQDALRRLRINVTRLHSAIASLKILSDLELKQRIAPTTAAAKRNLHDYLGTYLPFLYQQQAEGFVWTDFLRAALTLSEALTPNEFTTLRALHPAPGRGLRDQLERAGTALGASQPLPSPEIIWDVFLAHASADKAVARKLWELLKARVRVFFDAENVPLGADYDVTIRNAHAASFMTVVLVGDSSDSAYYLRSEVQTAIAMARPEDQRHRVVPIYLQGTDTRNRAQIYGLNLKQGIDLASIDDLPAAAGRIVDAVTAAR